MKTQIIESKPVALSKYVILRHLLSYPKPFYRIWIACNFAVVFNPLLKKTTVWIQQKQIQRTNVWIKQSATSRFYDLTNTTGIFYDPAIVASCIFVRQNKFRQPKTKLALPAGRDVFLQSRKTCAAVKSPNNKSYFLWKQTKTKKRRAAEN
jgi:hypothetical protein